MDKGPLQQLIDILYEAFDKLDARLAMQDLERIAVLVHRAMTVHARYFHTLEHVFSFSTSDDPIQALSACFHDIVYYQVDQGFHPDIEALVAPYIRQHNSGFMILDIIPQDDLAINLALDVFDFKPGHFLAPNNGLNEFLSALVMNRTLENIIAPQDLLKTTVCIEATIPFQGRNERGESHIEVLKKRLEAINQKYAFGFSREQIDDILKLAVNFSNKDTENFSEPDPGDFLDNTWKLLPESNPTLRWQGIYSVRDYRVAIQNMERFFSWLNPDLIFNRYLDEPPEEKYRQMVERAHLNVYTAREYLRVKLLAIAILEALVELTGGDAPLSLFTGSIPQGGEKSNYYEGYWHEPRVSSVTHEESIILRLLGSGRAHEVSFDLKNSPLSFFLFTRLGQPQINLLVREASAMFRGQITPQQFLSQIDAKIVAAVASACAEICFTRRERLMKLISELRRSEIA